MASGVTFRYRRQSNKFSELRRGSDKRGVFRDSQSTYNENNLCVYDLTVASQLASTEPFDCDCGRRFLVRLSSHQNKSKKSQRSRKDFSLGKKLFCSKDGCGCLCNADDKRSSSGMFYRNDSQVSNRESSATSRGIIRNFNLFGKSFCEDNSVANRRSSRNLNRAKKSFRNDGSVASRNSSRSRSRNFSRSNNSLLIAKKESSSQLPQSRRFGTQAQQNLKQSQSNSNVGSMEKSSLTVKREFETRAALKHLKSQNKALKESKHEGVAKFNASERVQKQANHTPVQSLSTQSHVYQPPVQSRSIRVERKSYPRTPRSGISEIQHPFLRSAQASTRSQSSSTRNEKRRLSKLTKKYFNFLPSSRSTSQSESRSLKQSYCSSENELVCNKCPSKRQELKEEKKQVCECCHQLKPLKDFEQSDSSFLSDLSDTTQTLKSVPRNVLNNLSQVANSAVERFRSISHSGSLKNEEKSQSEQSPWYSSKKFLSKVDDKVKPKARGKISNEKDLPSLRLKSPLFVNKKPGSRLQKIY